jgi:hypothetical protein
MSKPDNDLNVDISSSETIISNPLNGSGNIKFNPNND